MNEEAVDGAKIAAEILKAMDSGLKNRLVEAIKEKSPQLAEKINNKMLTFDEIKDITPQGIQLLINEVSHGDIVLSFKLASSEIQTMFLQNMSDRKKRMIQSDFENLGAIKKSEAQDAQRRILKTLDSLRIKGVIKTQSTNDIWI